MPTCLFCGSNYSIERNLLRMIGDMNEYSKDVEKFAEKFDGPKNIPQAPFSPFIPMDPTLMMKNWEAMMWSWLHLWEKWADMTYQSMGMYNENFRHIYEDMNK